MPLIILRFDSWGTDQTKDHIAVACLRFVRPIAGSGPQLSQTGSYYLSYWPSSKNGYSLTTYQHDLATFAPSALTSLKAAVIEKILIPFSDEVVDGVGLNHSTVMDWWCNSFPRGHRSCTSCCLPIHLTSFFLIANNCSTNGFDLLELVVKNSGGLILPGKRPFIDTPEGLCRYAEDIKRQSGTMESAFGSMDFTQYIGEIDVKRSLPVSTVHFVEKTEPAHSVNVRHFGRFW